MEYKLSDILRYHKVIELRDAAKSTGVQGYYRLNKEELVNRVANHILSEEYMNQVFECAYKDELKDFEKAARKKVVVPPASYQYLYWLNNYVAFETWSGEIEIPSDVQERYERIRKTEEYQEKRKRMAVMEQYALACVNLYGIIELRMLIQIINNQTKLAVTMEEAIQWCQERNHFRNCSMYFYENGYIMGEIYKDNMEDGKEDYHRLLLMQKGKPYYIPAKEELLRYADDIYIDFNTSFQSMMFFMKNRMKIEEEEAYEYCAEIQLGIRDNLMPSQIIAECSRIGLEFNDQNEVTGFLKCMMEMYKNTRVQENRGHTSAEIQALTLEKSVISVEDRKKLKEFGFVGVHGTGEADIIPFPVG